MSVPSHAVTIERESGDAVARVGFASAIVCDHPAVAECAAVGLPSEAGEDEVQIFVVARPGADLDPAELTAFLRPRMPRFMLPRFIQVTGELPKTPATQRVRKHELRALVDPELRWDRDRAANSGP